MNALDGIRILDFSRAMAGPFCTMMLGDLGAEVIKVERPDGGDDSRSWGPPFADEGGMLSAYFISANRNKRSLALDLKSDEGAQIARELIDQSDVLVENFRTGVMERLGIGYEQAKSRNEALVYCSISGYGRTGPYANRPGYDVVLQAEGGLMSITGPAGGPPYRVGIPIIDITTGMFAANAILAALRVSEKSGQGQHIDVSLLDTATALLSNVACNYLLSGEIPQAFGNAHPNLSPYGAFEGKDGSFVVGVANQRQWQRFCQAVDKEELLRDDRFRTNEARLSNRDDLEDILSERFAQRPVADWLEALEAIGIPCGPINDIAETFDHPQQDARQLQLDFEHPQAGSVSTPGFPYHYSQTPAEVRYPPPLLGEHTEEILTSLLGYSTEQAKEFQNRQTSQ